MEEDYIYWRHPTLPCIKVEEVSGGDRYSGKLWLEMALQIYCENGKESYRDIGHYANGAPFVYGSNARISITHCKGLLAVATLPDTPEVNLGEYSDRAALGIDAERTDREQVLKLRGKFLSDREQAMIPSDDVMANIHAWTIKEACYKAAFCEGVDFADGIRITKMPKMGPAVPVYDVKEYDYDGTGRGFGADDYGRAVVVTPQGEEREFVLYSYLSDECVVTLAYSPKASRFNRQAI